MESPLANDTMGALPEQSLGGKPQAYEPQADESGDATPALQSSRRTTPPRSWTYAPGRSNTKKEGDMRGEGSGCNRVNKKEERVLGTQTEKKGKHVGNTYKVPPQ